LLHFAILMLSPERHSARMSEIQCGFDLDGVEHFSV